MATPQAYPLFEHWYKTMDWIIARCERMPKSIRFSVSNRIINLAIETAELIVEAIYTRERQELLQRVNMNLEKLRLYFRLCKDRNHLSLSQYEYISRAVNEAGAMCGGWLKKQ